MTGCGETNHDNLPDLDNEFSEFKISYSGIDVTPGVKFDYKNVNEPWKNSRDAIQRGMQKLKGGYPADKAYKMDK